MSASQPLSGQSRCSHVIGPSLDKIIKNAAWRKHSHIVSACKSALDKLETIPSTLAPTDPPSPLLGLSFSDADFVLQPLILALESAYGKIVEATLECAFRLFSLNLVHAEIDDGASYGDQASAGGGPGSILRLLQGVCKSGGIGEKVIELGMLRVTLAAVRSPCLLIRGDCLVHIVRTCYNVYLGGQNGTNQICAKFVLAQMVVIVFSRAKEDSMAVNFMTVSVSKILEVADKNLNEESSIHFCQNFVNEVVDANDGTAMNKNLELHSTSDLQNGNVPGVKEDEKHQLSDA